MAHFYGTLNGSRGPTSRCGTKNSGMITQTASWEGAVKVYLWESEGVDMARVSLIPWHGAGVNRTLYDGPVSGGEPME